MVIDMCHGCQAFWFDAHESPRLSPGSTLTLFSVIGARSARPTAFTDGDVAKCPRCSGRLRLTHDRQRNTAFAYLRCPNGHGRLTTFFDFLREKDFVKPLSAQQIAELAQRLRTVNCSNCGAPVHLAAGGACTHCGSPLCTLDLPHAEALLAQLKTADEQATRPDRSGAAAAARRGAPRGRAGLRIRARQFPVDQRRRVERPGGRRPGGARPPLAEPLAPALRHELIVETA